jgi:hypothetical protein
MKRKSSDASLKTLFLGIFLGTTMLLISSELSIRKYDTRYVRGFSDNRVQRNIPELKPYDLVYDGRRNTVPLVIKEYNLIFFLRAKVASSEWIRFFMRLENNTHWCSKHNHLNVKGTMTLLSDYSLDEAQSMMDDPKWTKAMFVRHPKPRLLSAYLDKFVGHKRRFTESTCKMYGNLGGKNVTTCIEAVNREDFSFFLKEITTVNDQNVHWRSIYSTVDEKWWPFIDKIYELGDKSDEVVKGFLQSIKSNIDGVSAWDRTGKTGWGDNERDCNSLGDSAFMEKKDSRHKTDANSKMRQYYTPDLEKFVEQHYADDLNNPYFQFSPIKLFVDS